MASRLLEALEQAGREAWHERYSRLLRLLKEKPDPVELWRRVVRAEAREEA